MLVAVLYFQWHSSEVSSLSAVSGALRLRDPAVVYAEVEPGIYMVRRQDLRYQSLGPDRGQFKALILPCNAYLSSLGWTFEDQTGAGLRYRRRDQTLDAMFASCGPSYVIVTFYQDPVTGQNVTQVRPPNLFSE